MGLTMIAPNGEATAAASLSWDIQRGGYIYIFHLDPNLIWHDGKPFTAEDVSYKFKGAIIKKLDDHTLQVELEEIYAPLPVLLSQPLFRPNLNGLGLYKVVRLSQNEDTGTIDEITLYSQDKNFATETYKFFSNKKDAQLAFKLGEISILEGLDDDANLSGWQNVRIIGKTQYDRLVAIFYNLQNPYFKDKEVRQALAYAIAPFKDLERAVSPISPLSWGYSNKIRLYNYDQESARKILSKSQVASESSELVLSTYANLLPKAEWISKSWKEIGLNVKIRVVNTIPSDYQILLQTIPIPPDPDQYQYWQSTQETTNISHFSNPKIDKLLEDGRKNIELPTRKKIYADFQLYLIDDAPAIFLYYPKDYTIERK